MKDFTEGNITRQVINFSTPIIVGNVLISIYGISNMIWVGRLLGHAAVAAVTASLPIIMLLPAFLIGLGMATNVLIAQAFGRKDTAQLKKILANSFFSSMLFCLLISFVSFLFRRQLLEFVRTPKEIEEMALSYLTIMMSTLIFQFFIHWMIGMLRGLGDARTVLKILVLLTVLNITFVPLMISGFGPIPPLGVAGAAWGSALAALMTGVAGYIYLMQYNPYVNVRQWDFKLDWPIIRQVFVIGVPASLQMIVVSLANVFIIALVNRYGTSVTAAYGIGMQIDMLATIPFMSIGMAATTIAGQNLGVQRLDRVYETLRVSILLSMAMAVLCTTILFVFSVQISAFFLRDSADSAQVFNLVRDYYYWIAFIYPCFAVIFVIQGVLRSAGDTMTLLILSFTSMLVVRIPLAHVLAGPAGYRQDGIWIAILASNVLAVFLHWIYFRTGRWKKKSLLGHQKSQTSQTP